MGSQPHFAGESTAADQRQVIALSRFGEPQPTRFTLPAEARFNSKLHWSSRRVVPQGGGAPGHLPPEAYSPTSRSG
jgi:hypothetical protein